jgi:NitT/TauT family transport system substrate-binding protein
VKRETLENGGWRWLGWIDGERMKEDYVLVETYLGIEKPFAAETAFTTKLLDPAIKMDASKVGP